MRKNERFTLASTCVIVRSFKIFDSLLSKIVFVFDKNQGIAVRTTHVLMRQGSLISRSYSFTDTCNTLIYDNITNSFYIYFSGYIRNNIGKRKSSRGN
ncbi:unnamed protein product [Rhizophagus irregularis]|nr:unnamed protein product [Rhizophagus irregularis]CAB5295728.1 unnamed protein product [Rhizophagus irregularis]